MEVNDNGVLPAVRVKLGHPVAAFLYGSTNPRVRLDGMDIQTAGWGVCRIPVAPGRHRLEIWVPYVLPRKVGRAAMDFTLVDGEELMLEYMAPSFTFARGSLGSPGGQKSSGYSVIMIINAVAVALVLLTCMVSAIAD